MLPMKTNMIKLEVIVGLILLVEIPVALARG